MLRKIFLKVALLAGFCITPLYGYNWGCCNFDCGDTLDTGFLVGVYGSFHTFYFRARETMRSFKRNGNSADFYEHDDIQRAPGGGGYIGYGCCLCDRYLVALKGGVTGFASEARHAYHENVIDDNFATEERVKYVVDLFVQPGLLINECWLGYFKFGGSYVDTEQKASFRDNDTPFGVFDKVSENHHQWGFVFGYGLKASLSRCLSAFVESEWHSYPFSHNSGRVNGQPFQQQNVEFLKGSRINRLWGYGLNGGLSMRF